MQDRAAVLGLLVLAAVAWAVPRAVRFLRDRPPAAPRVVYGVAEGGAVRLLWRPRGPLEIRGADEGQILGPDGRPAGRVEGWEGLLLGRPLDLNRASRADLEALPGVGPATAQSLLETRDRLGGFRRWEDLLRVPGVGAKTLNRLRPWFRPLRGEPADPPPELLPPESPSGLRCWLPRRPSEVRPHVTPQRVPEVLLPPSPVDDARGDLARQHGVLVLGRQAGDPAAEFALLP